MMSEILTQIYPNDRRGQQQVEQLLQQEGIQRDKHLDYTCGLFNDNGELMATGSCFGNTLRCLAVNSVYQGQGLLNQVVSHLMDIQAQRGNFHLFLYTKCQSAKFFGDLGFYEIARVEEQAVFMENRRQGFLNFCNALAKQRRQGQSAAIVMNANPFTKGHQYLIERAAAENDTVHVFVLSEEHGPIPFAVRRKLVHEGTAYLSNVICHDSRPYLISSATFPSYFLRDDDTAICTHALLDVALFRQIAVSLGVDRRYVGEEPNSHVTALYNQVMRERLPMYGIACREMARLETDGQIISASTVRQAIHDGEIQKIAEFLPDSTLRYFQSAEATDVIAAIRAETHVIHY